MPFPFFTRSPIAPGAGRSPRQQMYQAGGMAPGSSVSPQGAAPASGGLAPFTTSFNHPGYQDHVASEQAAQDAREQWRNGPRPVAAPSLSMTPGQPLAEARARYAAARAAADQSLSDRNINTYNSMGRPVGYQQQFQGQGRAVNSSVDEMIGAHREQQARNGMTASQRAFVDGHNQIMQSRAYAAELEGMREGLSPEQQQVAANWYNQQANRMPQAPTPSQQASAYNLNLARQRYDQRQRDIRTARGVAQNPNSVASQELLNARAQLEFQNKQQQQAYLDWANHNRSMRDEYAKRLVHGQPVNSEGKPLSAGGATREQAIRGYNQHNQQAQGLGGFQPNQLSIQPGMPVQPIAPGAPVAPGAYSDPPTAPQASMLQRTGQFVESSLSPILDSVGGYGGMMAGAHLASKFFPAGRIASFALPAIGAYLGTAGTHSIDQATGLTKGVADVMPDELSGLAIPAIAAAGAYAYSKGKGKAPVNPGSGANPAAGAATPTYGPFPATPSGGSWPAGMKPGAPAPTPSPTPSSTYGPFPATPSGSWPSGMKPGATAPTPATPTGGQWPTMVKPTPAPAPAPAPAPRPAAPKSAPPSGVAPNPFTPKPVSAPTPPAAAPTPAAATPVTPPAPAASAATPPPAAVGDYIKSQKAKRESLPTSVQADMMKALETPAAPPASPPAPSVTIPVAGKPVRTRSKPKAKEPESAIATPTPTPEATPESTGISDQMMKTLMDVPPKRSKATPAPAEPAPAPPPVQTPDEILQELIHGKAPKSKAAPAPAPTPEPAPAPAPEPVAVKRTRKTAAKPASNPTEIVPGEKVAEPKKPRTKRESTSTPAAPADVAPTVTPKSKAVKKKEIAELDPNVVERALDTTSALQGNSVTRGQAMVHAKKLYSKGLLSDNDMSNLKVMSKDRDLDGEDLLSDMLSSVGQLQEQLADIRKAKRVAAIKQSAAPEMNVNEKTINSYMINRGPKNAESDISKYARDNGLPPLNEAELAYIRSLANNHNPKNTQLDMAHIQKARQAAEAVAKKTKGK